MTILANMDMLLSVTNEQNMTEYKHKPYTIEAIQRYADELNMSPQELINKLQEMFYLVGDAVEHKGKE